MSCQTPTSSRYADLCTPHARLDRQYCVARQPTSVPRPPLSPVRLCTPVRLCPSPSHIAAAAVATKDRTDGYPVMVSVFADVDGASTQLWGPGRQQLWFRKNRSQRTQSINDLQTACRALAKALEYIEEDE